MPTNTKLKDLILAARKLKHRAALARNAAMRVCLAPFRLLPVSSKRFGPLKGVRRSTPEFIREQGARYGCALHPLKMEECDPDRPDPITREGKPHWQFLRRKRFIPMERFVAEIPKGRIVGEEGYAIDPEDRILADITWECANIPARHSLLGRVSLPACREMDGRIFILSAWGSDGYYHWLFEVLPKLALLKASGVAADRYAVAVRQPFQKESLEILGIREDQRVALTGRSHIEAGMLVCASMPSLDGETSRWACQFLRESFCKAPATAERSRILIVRDTPGRRAWSNQDENRAVLERFGFVPVWLEEMTFREQIDAFSSAEVILAPHGAGLSNIVFAPGDATVVEIFSPRYVNPCYWKLACALGMRYASLMGLGEMPPDNVDPHDIYKDISVASKDLESILLRAGVTPLARA